MGSFRRPCLSAPGPSTIMRSSSMLGGRMRLSVIVPAYNEVETIAEILRRVRAVDLRVPMGYGPDNGSSVELER